MANQKTGIELIAAERQRQMAQEGFSPEHDDEHIMGEIAAAASCYAMQTINKELQQVTGDRQPPADWPWETECWKPSSDPIRNLVKAGALIAAEIDRINRSRNGK